MMWSKKHSDAITLQQALHRPFCVNCGVVNEHMQDIYFNEVGFKVEQKNLPHGSISIKHAHRLPTINWEKSKSTTEPFII